MEKGEFEANILKSIEKGIHGFIAKGEFFKNQYDNRIDVMPLVKNIYNKIDAKRLDKLIVANLEEVVAKKIVDKMTTEMGTDIKEMMSNALIRDEFKFYLRTSVEKILNKVREENN